MSQKKAASAIENIQTQTSDDLKQLNLPLKFKPQTESNFLRELILEITKLQLSQQVGSREWRFAANILSRVTTLITRRIDGIEQGNFENLAKRRRS